MSTQHEMPQFAGGKCGFLKIAVGEDLMYLFGLSGNCVATEEEQHFESSSVLW
jgi:hypothetical protein